MTARCSWPLVWAVCLCGCGGQPGADEGPLADNALVERRLPEEIDVSEAPPPALPAPDTGQEGSSSDPEEAGRDTKSPDELEDGDAATVDAAGLPAAEPKERFILLVPGGPLIVDLVLTVDGTSPDAALRRRVEEELAAADVNRDGRSTWREVANSMRFRYGNVAYNPSQVVRFYDRNRDGMADSDEMFRFLVRNTGPRQSFSLQSSGAFSDPSRSALRRFLDGDGDGVIGPEEMAQAAARLVAYDADDDEVVTPADFRPEDESARSTKPVRRTDDPELASQINERTDWNYLAYSLSERYAMGGPLSVDDVSLTPDVGAALDVDQDGIVAVEEVKGLVEIAPHLVLNARFDERNPSDEPRRAQLQLQSVSDRLEDIGELDCPHAKHVSLALPETRIEFFVNQDPMLYNTTVDSIDADGDGRINQCELALYLDRRQDIFRHLVRARASNHEDALFAALDADGDGKLDARELQQTSARLQSLDRNGDKQLQTGEIPKSIMVGFVRGDPRQDAEMFVVPSPTTGQQRHNWFTAMDVNEDGEISRREFLGTAGQFQLLDRDTDGFIGGHEAVY